MKSQVLIGYARNRFQDEFQITQRILITLHPNLKVEVCSVLRPVLPSVQYITTFTV